uniref:Divalent anion:Na symporter (DASS) family protein pu n=1 Tax=Albugo laibachii Nc14 TaxID=890382 RepID=F0WBX4_9STRA|nr:divalent anion:Na symporter (DASS) family protein pu [Albugo laibachii Nc14]|eukprot:CCA18653.1 divalent anion:Na symporter (DASS) family protein pu [Albugo laibachii Nc14]
MRSTIFWIECSHSLPKTNWKLVVWNEEVDVSTVISTHFYGKQVKLIPFAFSFAIFNLLLLVRITPEGHDAQQRCLAMLVFITLLWITEAIPYFATALLVPPLVVFLQILGDKSDPDNVLPAKKAAKKVMSLLVNHTTILIMGGYSISAAFGKCQIELYIAAALQRRFKKRPNLFLLAIMLMGLFLSMWISNHTAPVLCVSVLLPIIRDFPTNSAYVKTLLVGLAFACNLGGMMTPISSLQNTLAVSYLEKAGYTISFGQWMAMAVPFCTFTTILCWAFLLWVFDPKDAKCIPQIVYDQKQKISRVHVTVITLTLLTILLWATFTFTSPTFGDLGIISLIFMFVMFGTGILSQFDFNSFSWHILFLIGGGNVLGDAVQQSGLLDTLSHSLIQSLPNNSVWLVSLSLSLVVLSLTTFVSHTVASIIMLPIIVQISVEVGHPHIPVICCALSISAAMALPFSSFPNINSLLVLDDHGQPYLKVQDFLRVGILFSLITVFLIVTVGYGLILAVFGFYIPAET